MKETYEDTFVAWDVIAGKLHPEFGGATAYSRISEANLCITALC